jgi:hypothetical protein
MDATLGLAAILRDAAAPLLRMRDRYAAASSLPAAALRDARKSALLQR